MAPQVAKKLQRHRAGLTLVELVVVLSIFVLALSEISRSLLAVSRLEPTNRETALALDGATSMLERLRAADFARLLDLYDDDPANDPDGPGTAPGAGFAVPGIQALDTDADGLVGRIELPLAAGALREDTVDATLGLPRDLDGDGAIDAVDHRADYDVLPVRVRLEWSGASGVRSLVLVTTIVES